MGFLHLKPSIWLCHFCSLGALTYLKNLEKLMSCPYVIQRWLGLSQTNTPKTRVTTKDLLQLNLRVNNYKVLLWKRKPRKRDFQFTLTAIYKRSEVSMCSSWAIIFSGLCHSAFLFSFRIQVYASRCSYT